MLLTYFVNDNTCPYGSFDVVSVFHFDSCLISDFLYFSDCATRPLEFQEGLMKSVLLLSRLLTN